MKPADITLFLQSFFPDCTVEESKTGRSDYTWKLKSKKEAAAMLSILEKSGKKISSLTGVSDGEYEDVGLPGLAKIVSKNMVFWKNQLTVFEERIAAHNRRKNAALQIVTDLGQDARARQHGEFRIFANSNGSMELTWDSGGDTVGLGIRITRLSLADARELGLLLKPFMVACQ